MINKLTAAITCQHTILKGNEELAVIGGSITPNTLYLCKI